MPGSEKEVARFASTPADPTAQRLVWHPDVHRWFDESCFFFLLRMVSPLREIIDQELRKLLKSSGIGNASVYLLLGPYDALIRVWATESKRRTFLVNARNSPTVVDQLHEFRTEDDGIFYRWWDNQLPRLSNEDRERSFAIAKSVLKTTESHSAAEGRDVSQLEERGLVARTPRELNGGQEIKFYMAFDAQAVYDRAIPDRLIKSLDAHFDEQSQGSIHSVAIYRGIGFGRVLLKAVADDFHSLVAESERLTEIAARSDFRPMTLILIHHLIESDAIENVEDDLSPGVLGMADFLRERLGLSDSAANELRARLTRLRPVDREPYAQLFQDYRDLLTSGPDAATFARLLHALLMDDVEEFGDSMLFLQKTESMLRRYLRRQWVDAYGSKDWANVVRNRLASSEKQGKEKQGVPVDKKAPSEWTLGDLLELAEAVAPDSASHSALGEVDSKLGNDWRSIVHRAIPLRNEFAHGRIYEFVDLSAYYPTMDGSDRSQKIRSLLDAARLYVRLSGVVG